MNHEIEIMKKSYQGLAEAFDQQATLFVKKQTVESKLSDLQHEFAKVKVQIAQRDDQMKGLLDQLMEKE